MLKYLIFKLITHTVLNIRLPCLEFITHLTFFLSAYSGRWSESSVIAECLKQYGFHFLTLSKSSNFCLCCSSAIDPCTNSSLLILDRNLFSTSQIASGFIGAPVFRLQISLGSFLKGCLLIQS